MLDSLVANVGEYVHTNPWLALVAVFAGGALTASNPCVLAMIPLTMSFVAGQPTGRSGVVRAFLFSSVFVLGLSITFSPQTGSPMSVWEELRKMLDSFRVIAGQAKGDS